MKEKGPVMAIAFIGMLILVGTFVMNFITMRKVGKIQVSYKGSEIGELPAAGPIVDFGEPITVNLREPERYVRVDLSFELNAAALGESSKKGKGHEGAGGGGALEDQLKERSPVIRDAIIKILREKSFQELKEPDSPARLQKEILYAIDKIMGKNRIRAVYFKELVME